MFGRFLSTRMFVFTPVLVLAVFQLSGCTRVAEAPPGGVYRSESAGGSFAQSVQVIDAPGSYIADFPLRTIDRPAHAPETIYIAAGDRGVVVSHNDGVDWDILATPLTATTDILALENGTLVATGVDGVGQGFIIRSLDDGRSWQSVMTVPVPREDKGFTIVGGRDVVASVVLSLERDPFNPDRIYAGSSLGTLFVGEQSAKVWSTLQVLRPIKQISGQSTSRVPISNIVVSPNRQGELLVTTQEGALLRVRDGEQEQVVVPQYISSAPPRFASTGDRIVADVTHIPGFPDALLVGTTSGAVVTRDGGASWVELNVPAETNIEFNSMVVRVSPTNVNRMFVAINSVMYRSEDGGRTWNTFALGLPNHVIVDISINPTNAAKMLMVAQPLL